MTSELIAQVDDLLPQTQCRQCGYRACLPYAEAMVREGVAIDRCPPGGDDLRRALAQLLERELPPPAESTGEGRPPVFVALIREDDCIGCTKCIQACPVDAIVGAATQMHTVIAAWCTGCELCVPPCPTDCIELIPSHHQVQEEIPDEAAERRRAMLARTRFQAREQRLRCVSHAAAGEAALLADLDVSDPAVLGAEIEAAVARARLRRDVGDHR